MIGKGAALSGLGRITEALTAYDQALELDPENAMAWNHKGHALNRLGRYQEALAAFDRAVKFDANSAYAWENRGWAKLGLGQIGESVNDFFQAIKLNGTRAGALEGLAKASVLQGNWAEAERVLRERFRLPPWRFDPARSQHLPDLIATIFRTSTDCGMWTHRVDRLADIAREVQEEMERKKGEEPVKPTSSPTDTAGAPAPPRPLAVLGDSLVRSLTDERLRRGQRGRPRSLGGLMAEGCDGDAATQVNPAWICDCRSSPRWPCGASGLLPWGQYR